jgi:tetrachloro-p-hydroquinone reductive dehalogenase
MATVLYDFPMSIYCQFTRLALAEKGVEYERKHVDITKPQAQFEPGYLELNPKGVVPTLVVDGRVICHGPTINAFIDTQFEGPALASGDAEEIDHWVRAADEIQFDALLYDQRRPGPGLMMLQGRRARLAAIVRPDERIRQRLADIDALIEFVQDPGSVEGEIMGLRAKLVALNDVLDGRSFITGEHYTLADVMWTPTLARIEMLGLDERLFGDSSNVIAYYERMRQRPSFERARIFRSMSPTPGSA